MRNEEGKINWLERNEKKNTERMKENKKVVSVIVVKSGICFSKKAEKFASKKKSRLYRNELNDES